MKKIFKVFSIAFLGLILTSSYSLALITGDNFILAPYLEAIVYKADSTGTANIPIFFKILNSSNNQVLVTDCDLHWEINKLNGVNVKQGTSDFSNGAFSGFSGYKQWPHSQSISAIRKTEINGPISVDLPPGKYIFVVSLKDRSNSNAFVLVSNMRFTVN
jgi:hypothetical protein